MQLNLALPGAILVTIAGITASAAADIPGNASTKAVLPVRTASTNGLFETNGDVDWYRVRLTKGQDYAVRFSAVGEQFASLTLRDPNRKAVGTVPSDIDTDGGLEYRAKVTGTYFVDVRRGVDPNFQPGDGYAVAVAPDCRDAASTTCTLRPGKPQRRVTLYLKDWDRFALNLVAGRKYALTVTKENGDVIRAQLLDAKGKVLENREVFGDPAATIDFTAKATGRYYLRTLVASDDTGYPYVAELTRR